MSTDNQNLYQEQTLFDQLGEAVVRFLRRFLRRLRLPEWSELFKALSCFYLLGASGLIIIGMANATRWQQYAAILTGSILLSVTAWQFIRFVLPTACGKAGVKARWVKLPEQVQGPAEVRKEPESNIPSQSGDFINELKDAGINVRIAQILFRKGLNSVRRIRQVDDRALFSIKGIGPATVLRLRARFGMSRKIA